MNTGGYKKEHVGRARVVAEGGVGNREALVTIAISLYNYEGYIRGCLDTVAAQTIEALNLIVLDDCSSDKGLDLVREWLNTNGDRFRSFQLLQHIGNRGLSSARNTTLAWVRTKYTFILDADNELYPRCLETLVSAMEHCDANFSYCYQEKFGNVRALQNLRPWNPSSLKFGNTIDAMALFRSDDLRQCGGYSENDLLRLGWEDFEVWFKLARQKKWGVLVPQILARYRVHGKSMLHTTTNPNADRLWQHLKNTYPEFFVGSS